ncbi:MAG TPA: hypothetical protein VK611_19400 [Acidimicrobiales bacterium]|nr:hypothetical protein [Acidimicrobiales bacterium]
MFLHRGRKAVALVGLVALLGVAACGDDDDDGASVRESGDTSGSGSGSGSGSASGTGSGSGSGSGSGTADGEECVLVGASDAEPTETVEVTLQEFTIEPVPDEIPAGTVEFAVTNDGTEIHEIVIVKFDGEPGDIPTADDGSADEAQLPAGTEVLEIEGFAGEGKTCTAAFDLEAGSYALFCNIVEEEDSGELEAHYQMGMYTSFTVT